MKRLLSFAGLFFIAILFTVASCGKKEVVVVSTGKVYTGKVLKSMCGNVAVMFTDGTKLGQIGWLDPSDSIEYNYVFRVANPCDASPVGALNNPNGYIKFRFRGPSVQNCVQCLAWVPTPDTAYNIIVIE